MQQKLSSRNQVTTYPPPNTSACYIETSHDIHLYK